MPATSKIESILFSEFHVIEGPKIVLQVPEEIITKKDFDALHTYIIPKEQLHRKIIRVNSHGHTIIGYLISIKGENFERNAFVFNCCLVLNSSTDSGNYENIVKKLNVYLEHMVLQGFCLYDSDKENLWNLLTSIYNDLNESGHAHYISSSNKLSSLHLQIDTTTNENLCVGSYDVPIFCSSSVSNLHSFLELRNNLAGKEIVALINGERHVRRIAYEADMDISIVKDCLKYLVLHGSVHIIPIFQYSNVYVPTPKISKLFQDSDLQGECIKFVSLSERKANFGDIFTFYSSFVQNVKMVDLCQRLNPRIKGIDEKKLVQFGLTKGLIRRIKIYPMKDLKTTLKNHDISVNYSSGKTRYIDDLVIGVNSFDDICGKIGLSCSELSQQLEGDPSILFCRK